MPTVIDSLVVSLGLDASKFTQGQKDAADALRKFEQESEHVGKTTDALGVKLSQLFTGIKREAIGLLGAFIGGRGIKEFISYMTQADAATGRLSKQMDISTSTLSKWGYVGTQTGGTAESMAESMYSLEQAIQTFQNTGQGEFLPVMDLLNISLYDANRNLKPIDQIMKDINKGAAALDPSKTARLVNLLSMIPGLNRQSINALILAPDVLQKMLDRAEKLGPATEKSADAAIRLGRAWDDFTRVGEGFLGRPLIVALASFFEASTSMLLNWKKQVEGWFTADTPTGKSLRKMFGMGDTGGIEGAAKAIASIESRGSGGYSAIGPADRRGDIPYGKYQVMGNNVGPWTKEVLGRALTPQEFLSNPAAQDAVAKAKLQQYHDKYGSWEDAASMWISGKPLSAASTARDALGTNRDAYVEKFRQSVGARATASMGAGGKAGSSSTSSVQINAINVYGVKDANEAAKKIGPAITQYVSQATAGLRG